MTLPRAIPTLNFDPSLYSRAPILNVASGIALAQALGLAVPADAEPTVQAAARHLAKIARSAQAAWAARQRHASAQALSPDERRRIDLSADRGWGALRAILEAKAGLPHDRYPESAPAGELYTRLFVGGTEFLSWPYAEQHAAMDTLLRRIDAEDLAGLIDALCGPDLLRYLRDTHKEYRAMALARPPEDTDEVAARPLLTDLSAAVVHYALNVCATVQPGDAASARRARAALAPIDALRAQQAGRPDPDEDPTPAPIPPPAPGPAAPAAPTPAPGGDPPR